MNYKNYLQLVLLALIFSCSEEDGDGNMPDPNDPNDPIDETPTTPITTNLRTFIFGHSLLVHEPVGIPKDETTVPHWVYKLSQESEFDFGVSGQYGFLPQHANLPPIAQWGFEEVPGLWDSENEDFDVADFNTVLLTAGNFVQYKPATENYDGDANHLSPVTATTQIVEWVHQQEDDMQVYIYENWPDMAPYLSNGFPATEAEHETYRAFTEGDFHTWWLDYHDAVMEANPDRNVRMIPVGPVISKLLSNILTDIPVDVLYEDDAPHGRPTIYFLAGLVTYMAMYGTEAPADYVIPDSIHADVAANYDAVVAFVWNELNNFTDTDGNSRVW